MKNYFNKIYISVILFLIILFFGYGAGRLIGTQIIKGVLKGSKTVLLFYRPPFEFIITANLLSSYDELKRMEGYYSLLDNNVIDTDSLIERYKDETIFIKPTIIWLMGFSGEKDRTLKFLSEEYQKADKRIKSEILKSMRMLDESYFIKFSGINKN
jgi:hypothetical protein